MTLSYWMPWAVAGLVVVAAARRFPLRRKGLAGALGVHLGLTLTLPLAVLALDRWLRTALGYPPRSTFGVDYFRTLNTSTIIYWGLVVLVELGARQRGLREREQRAAELAGRLKEAQLRSLQARIEPHFLFNTLNAIQAHVREDPGRADDMVAALADLLRATLREDVPAEVPLREELDFIGRYLDLQSLRLGDRLKVRFDVDPSVQDAPVPHFVLQPLVENAVEHGVASRSEVGNVEIRGRVENGMLVLSVEDDGPGPAWVAARRDPGPIGLANTRERLVRRYGPEASLDLRAREGGGARATVCIPFSGGGWGSPR